MTKENKPSYRILMATSLGVLLAATSALPASAGIFETIGKVTGGPLKELGRPMDKFYGGIADTAGRTAKKIFAPDPPHLDARHGTSASVNKGPKKPLDPGFSKQDVALSKNLSDLSKKPAIKMSKLTNADMEQACEKQNKMWASKLGQCITYGGK